MDNLGAFISDMFQTFIFTLVCDFIAFLSGATK